MPDLINSRSGGKRVLGLANSMCRVVRAGAPAIRATYPASTALLAVLTAAEALCALLPSASAEMAALDATDFVFDPPDSDPLPGATS